MKAPVPDVELPSHIIALDAEGQRQYCRSVLRSAEDIAVSLILVGRLYPAAKRADYWSTMREALASPANESWLGVPSWALLQVFDSLPIAHHQEQQDATPHRLER